MHSALHHQHLRKRIYENLEAYPHPNWFKRFLDKLIFVIGILGPLFTLPQVYTIYVHKNASGVSAFTWVTLFLFSTVWIAYGIAHKEKVIIITYTLWFFINGMIALGAILY